MKHSIKLFLLLYVFAACHNGVSEADKMLEAKKKNDNVLQASKAKRINIAKLKFADKSDPSCGMPLTAGVEDTVTVKGKLYGFCAKECKEQFLALQQTKKLK